MPPGEPVGPPRREHALDPSALSEALRRGRRRRGPPLDVAPALAQAGPVRLGVLAAKAGVLAPVGESGLRGVQFATDRINAAGGILGRKLELIVEEESSPKDTVERFRKLALQDKVDAVSGAISTGVGLALGPAAEEMKTIWLAWDATTQKGVEESMPRPKYSFRSTDNECEAVMASILTARLWKGNSRRWPASIPTTRTAATTGRPSSRS